MDTTERIGHGRRAKLTDANVGQQEPHATTPQNFKYHASALSWGLAAGLFMAVFLLFLQMAGQDSIALKFFKYVFLIGFLGWGLWKYRTIDQSSSFFQQGIKLGAMTTFYAALSLVVVGFVVALAAPDLAFQKFNLAVDSPGDLIVTNVVIFFEVLVFGMVATFIWLQYLKNKPFAKPDRQ